MKCPSHVKRLKCYITGHGPDYGVYDMVLRSGACFWTELRCESCGAVLATDWSYDGGEI